MPSISAAEICQEPAPPLPSLLDALSKDEVENPALLPLTQAGSSDEESKARETFIKILEGSLNKSCADYLAVNGLPANDYSKMVFMAVCLAKRGESNFITHTISQQKSS